MIAAARKIKVYVTQGGEAHFVDPDLTHVALLRRFHPDFRIRFAWPPHDFVPNLARTKSVRIGVAREVMAEAEDDFLWQLHADCLAGKTAVASGGAATLLDLKVELAKRELLACNLCGHRCGVNRFLTPGKCGLKDKAYLAETFVHIAEEAVLTPAATVKLYNCGLNCAACQAFEIIHVKEAIMAKQGRLLDGTVWRSCDDFAKAATIEFAGGNPTESLYPVMQTLAEIPPELSTRPMVWNDHSYTTAVAYQLLDGVVDVFLADFKGSSACVEQTSKVKGYWECATAALAQMVQQRARIIVRILVLPGHLECCHRPALEVLAQYRERLWLSVLPFLPLARAGRPPQINRPTDRVELAEVHDWMERLGLRDVDDTPDAFWFD